METYRLPNIMARLSGALWFIKPDVLETMMSIFNSANLNMTFPVKERKDKSIQVKEERGKTYISVEGEIMYKASQLDTDSGFVNSTELYDAIISTKGDLYLYLDTPGGTATGTPEIAEELYSQRMNGRKIYSFIDNMCCSAGYYIASASNEIYSTPSSVIGSIGTMVTLRENKSIKAVTSGKLKAIGAGEISQEQLDYLQDRVNKMTDDFAGFVAKSRGIGKDDILALEGKSEEAKNLPFLVTKLISLKEMYKLF